MMGVFKSIPISLRVIFRDPINLLLALIPTAIALGIYVFTIVAVFKNSDYLGLMVRDYLPDPKMAGWVGKLITAIFIVFIFLIMSWTFIIVVGIISAPFNSMLSLRIETMLVGRVLERDKGRTFKGIFADMGRTFKSEAQKLFFILLLTVTALVLNFFPLFYPVGLFLLALLVGVQFVDYSWSRHGLRIGSCTADVLKNFLPYSLGGLFFLVLMTVPLINALVPALATSYFTVLWLHRQGKLQ